MTGEALTIGGILVSGITAIWYYFKSMNEARFNDLKEYNTSFVELLTNEAKERHAIIENQLKDERQRCMDNDNQLRETIAEVKKELYDYKTNDKVEVFKVVNKLADKIEALSDVVEAQTEIINKTINDADL